MTELPQAGWYPDSAMVNTLRYWDGTTWTEYRAPTPPPVWTGWMPAKVGPWQGVKNFWTRAFTYSGRATRMEYNAALALYVTVAIVLAAAVVGSGLRPSPVVAAIIAPFVLLFLIPWPALIARRCHDMNRSGLFGLLFLASNIGFLVAEGFMVFAPSNPLGARFEPTSPYMAEIRTLKRSRPLGLTACALVLLAAVAAIAPVVEIVEVSSRPVAILGQGPERVELPAHTKYGLFFSDPQNLGYSESCTATDGGSPVELQDPGFFMTSSDTDNLDMVFNTGSGHLTIDCESSAAQVAARPVPNYSMILAGFGASLLLGLVAAVFAILWVARVGAQPDQSEAL